VESSFLGWSVILILMVFATPLSADAYEKQELVAPPDKALVVFIQNQKVDRKMTFVVFESDKRCVAEVGGREVQVLPVEPAPLLLYVTGYNKTQRIEIYPEAGRTYFVRLHTVDKPMGRSPEVTLVRRSSEEHKLLKFHLDGGIVTRTIGDDKFYGKPLKERKNRTQRRLNEGNADWKNGDDAYRDRYMLIEKDGLTAADIALL
jgi:hypothetical protein